MNNAEFFEKAFWRTGPKIIAGFSRPVYHNLAGLRHGHRFNKAGYGGMIRHTEAGMLYQWASRLPPNSVIVEIGCYGGLSTSYLATGCAGNGSKIYAIDPFASDLNLQAARTDHAVRLEDKPSRDQVAQRLKQNGLAQHVELIEGYSQEVVKTWNRKIDFLWIDGNHDRAYEDYTDWAPFLRPRARVALHDAHPVYGLAGVAEAARKIFSTDEWVELEHVKSIITGVRRS